MTLVAIVNIQQPYNSSSRRPHDHTHTHKPPANIIHIKYNTLIRRSAPRAQLIHAQHTCVQCAAYGIRQYKRLVPMRRSWFTQVSIASTIAFRMLTGGLNFNLRRNKTSRAERFHKFCFCQHKWTHQSFSLLLRYIRTHDCNIRFAIRRKQNMNLIIFKMHGHFERFFHDYLIQVCKRSSGGRTHSDRVEIFELLGVALFLATKKKTTKNFGWDRASVCLLRVVDVRVSQARRTVRMAMCNETYNRCLGSTPTLLLLFYIRKTWNTYDKIFILSTNEWWLRIYHARGKQAETMSFTCRIYIKGHFPRIAYWSSNCRLSFVDSNNNSGNSSNSTRTKQQKEGKVEEDGVEKREHRTEK